MHTALLRALPARRPFPGRNAPGRRHLFPCRRHHCFGHPARPAGTLCSLLRQVSVSKNCNRKPRKTSTEPFSWMLWARPLPRPPVRALCARIETLLPAGEYISYPYSPGYCGWDISEQEKVFALLHPDPQVVRLNASCLMTPIKSVSGILGLGPEIRKQAYGCKMCGRRDCYKNRER